jgi:predicted deacylase
MPIRLLLSLGLGFASLAAQAAPDRYESVRALLRDLAAKHPGNTSLFELGMSDSGRPIEGLRVGDGPVKNLVVATHHGNEYGSTEVAKAFAAAIAAAPIAGQTVFVIPVLNIAGYDRLSRRESASGVSYDPNRNYPGPCGTEGPFTLKSTSLLANFIAAERIVASATLHTFYPAVVYPWGMSTHDTSTPYDDLYKMLVQAATVESGYPVGNSTQLIYPADGTYEDYAFWKHGIWSLLFEIGESHNPSDGDVARSIAVNVPGLRRMLEQAPRARAERHEFAGRCDRRLAVLDRHDE